MVTVTAFTRSGNGRYFEAANTPVTPIANTHILTAPVSPGMTHCFVGIQQFESDGTTPGLSGAGSYQISVKFVNSEVWEDLSGTIDATAPTTQNFAGNVSAVRCVPTGITTVVKYSLHLTANRR